jgi:hypothetical protein
LKVTAIRATAQQPSSMDVPLQRRVRYLFSKRDCNPTSP